MSRLTRWTRLRAFVPVLALTALLSACDDSPTDEEHDPGEEVATVRITIGSNAAIVLNAANGAVTSGPNPAVIGAGTHAVAIEFLDDAGASLNGELAAEFEARLTPASPAVTFARTGAFSGTLTRVSAGSTSLAVALWHIAEGHEDVGPFSLALTVQ